jgi:regulation of enolase protein 1 (concanavalin A-like superfamily)
MIRYLRAALCSLAACVSGCGRTPALVPDPKPLQTMPGWGAAYDPDGDCQIQKEGDRVTINVPGTPRGHGLSVEAADRQVNSPRILRDVDGDFVVSVKVVGSVKPGGGQSGGSFLPYHGAGILLWQDSNNYVRLERAAILRGTQVISYVNFEQRRNGRMIDSRGQAIPDAPTILRLERQGSQLFASISPDGERWTPLPPMAITSTPSWKVGVAAVSNTKNPFPAEFEGLVVTGESRKGQAGGEPGGQ